MAVELLVGPAASGKTNILMERYHKLAQDERTDSILVLLWNARDVKLWREELSLPQAGLLNIYTYFGWVQRELRRHWLSIESGSSWLEPEFLTVETAQFIMLEQLQPHLGLFSDLTTSPERLAIQLGSCQVLASLNGLDARTVGARLAAARPEADARVFDAAQKVMNAYSEQLDQYGILDYGQGIEIYQTLLQNSDYQAQLCYQYRHLLVDDIGELPPAAHDLVEALLPTMESVTLTFASDGGHGAFFGADPDGAWQRFGSLGRRRLVRSSRQQWLGAGHKLYCLLSKDIASNRPVKTPALEYIHADLRSELLEDVGRRLVRLVEAGCEPGEIAVVAPVVDKVMEHSFSRVLTKADIPVNVLTKNKRLLDQPFVRAMMTVTLLAHPDWHLDWGRPDLVQSLEILLKTDPVRSWLLARQLDKSGLRPLDLWLRERVGFGLAEKYDLLQGWLEFYKTQAPMPIDVFLQRVFGELLSQLPPSAEDLVVCRQLIASAQKFRSIALRFPHLADSTGEAFISMLGAGTVAAESLLDAGRGGVILATPYAYHSGHYCSRVQVWMDCTSRRWFHQDAREVLNPYVLRRDWQFGRVWTDEDDVLSSSKNGARSVQALLRRCGERLIITSANVDSQGYEQDGYLLEAVHYSLGGGGADAL